MYKEYENKKLSLKTKVKDESKYSDEVTKERDLGKNYLLRMFLDQEKIFEEFKKKKVNNARLLRFLIDSFEIFEILLKYCDEEFNLDYNENWSTKDFNQFYDYMKKFREYYVTLRR